MALKTTLINPPQIFTKSQVASGLTPPLGVAYLASYLLAHDCPVQVVDALGEAPQRSYPFRKDTFLRGLTLDETVERIDGDTRVVGISNLFSFAWPVVEELARRVRARLPDAVIVLGGNHPSALFREVLESCPFVDWVARGEEGEESLLRLVRYLEGQLEYDALTGLATRDAQGQVVELASAKRIADLTQGTVPFPARHLLPMENYIQAQEGHGPSTGRWTSILSSRGCPYGCTFCGTRRTKWVARPATDVVDEMEHCMRQWGIEEFHFEDDNMTINEKRLIEICDEIMARGLRLRWQTPNGIRASRTSDEMLAKMKASGCMHVTLAPESGSARVLKEIVQKGNDFSLEQLKSCGARAHQLGLKVAAYFILGMPGERAEDIEASISYARELAKVGVDEVAFGLFIPLPGTPLFDAVRDKLEGMDWLDLLVIGDLGRAKSWNDLISDDALHAARRRAYLTFHMTRLVYHPWAFLRTFFNVVRSVEETKTERTLRQFLQRRNLLKKRFVKGPAPQLQPAPQATPASGQDLNAYPYDERTTLKMLWQNGPHYAYGHSLLKALRLALGDVARALRGRPRA